MARKASRNEKNISDLFRNSINGKVKLNEKFKVFQQMNILEIGCNKGHYTKGLISQAKSVHVVDINKKHLEITQKRLHTKRNLTFEHLSSYKNIQTNHKKDGLFIGVTIADFPRQELNLYLKSILKNIKESGQILIFGVNKSHKGFKQILTRQDEFGNTYYLNKLESGESIEVRRNYFQKSEIINLTKSIGSEINYDFFGIYWILSFKKN